MSRIVKFFVGDIKDFEKEFSTKSPNGLHSIRVLESDTFDGNYVTIDTQKVNPSAQYIITDRAADDFTFKWYRLEFIGDPAANPVVSYGKSEPIVPEVIATIIDDVRSWLGDTDLTKPAWLDSEYVQMIRFSFLQYKGERNLTFIRDEDVYAIQLLVREACASTIAYDHAKYYLLQTPSAQLDKGQISVHYNAVAAAIRDQYTAYERRLNRQSGGYNEDGVITQMPAPLVTDAVRFSRTGGFRVRGIDPSVAPARVRRVLGGSELTP